MRYSQQLHFFLACALAVVLAPGVGAQEKKSQDQQEQKPLSEGLPKRELSKKQRARREQRLRKELERHYKKWLQEDVAYIIMGEERDAFKHLNTEEEREQFVEQFWLRRDPTPDTIENEYREEHYRRIAYSNERFASGIPGWKADRGRIYIMHGEPAEIESHPSGGMYERLPEEGGGSTSTYPFERWRYRYLEGVGTNVILEFVDTTGTGEYRLTMDPSEKDALTMIPGAGLSQMEQLGLASKTDRFTRSDGTRMPTAMGGMSMRMQQFERLALFAAVQKPPPVKFKDLEALVHTRVSFNLLPFEMRADFVRITDETILVPVTIAVKKKDMTFEMREGLQHAVVNVFGRITTMTGRIVQTFEDVIELDIPPALFEQGLNRPSVYQKAVPRFDESELAHSSLILADLIERVPTRNVGTGQFVIGETKVRPAVDGKFTPDARMGIYMQVYNLGIDEATHQPNAVIDYEIVRGDETVFQYSEKTSDLERAGQQITLEKILPLDSFGPGEYKLSIRITDNVRQQTVSPSTRFRILP